MFQTVKLFENLSLSPILSVFRLVNIKNICSIIANEDKTIGIDKNSFWYGFIFSFFAASKKVCGWIKIIKERKIQIHKKANKRCLSNIIFENLSEDTLSFFIIFSLQIVKPIVLPFQIIGKTI